MEKIVGQLKNIQESIKGSEPFFISQNPEIGVLMLHGFTSTPYQFRELGNYLANKGLTIYAPLIAGHGTSPRDLSKTSISDWMSSVEEAFLKLKEKTSKVVVIGHSFGGNLAFHLARKHGQAMSGIVSLGTPITLRWHNLIKLRMYTYGWFKRYYRKSGRNYKIDYIESSDQVSYPVIPVKSLRDFYTVIEQLTIPILHEVKSPTLIMQVSADPIVHPKSAQQLHEHLGSDFKKVCWLNGCYHGITDNHSREQIYGMINNFIEELSANKFGNPSND